MRKYSSIAFVLTLAILLSACTATRGSYSDKSHFVYPNSNVEPIGETQAVLEKSSIFIPPTLDRKEVDNLIEKAISKQSGADILIDYKTETERSNYGIGPLMYHELRVIVEGTAADMEVGEQDLTGSKLRLPPEIEHPKLHGLK